MPGYPASLLCADVLIVFNIHNISTIHTLHNVVTHGAQHGQNCHNTAIIIVDPTLLLWMKDALDRGALNKGVWTRRPWTRGPWRIASWSEGLWRTRLWRIRIWRRGL